MKVTVFLAEGFEEIEAVTPIDYLRRAGQEVTLVAVPADGKSGTLVRGSHGISINADATLDAYFLDSEGVLPDAVFIPGGMPGALNVSKCEPVLDFIKKMFAEKKLVTAICAAPVVVLAKTGVLAGRSYTCYPGMNENLGEYCGSPEKAALLTKDAKLVEGSAFVKDGNLITGRGPGAAEQFAMAIVEELAGKESAGRIKAGSVQR